MLTCIQTGGGCEALAYGPGINDEDAPLALCTDGDLGAPDESTCPEGTEVDFGLYTSGADSMGGDAAVSLYLTVGEDGDLASILRFLGCYARDWVDAQLRKGA